MAGGARKKDKKKKDKKKNSKAPEVPLKSPSRRIKKPTRYDSEDELERQLLQEALDISKKEVRGRNSRSTRRNLEPAEKVQHTPEKATRRSASRSGETPSSVVSKASSKPKTSEQSTPKRRGAKRSRVELESEEEQEAEEAEGEGEGEVLSSEPEEDEDEASAAESEVEEPQDSTTEPKAKRFKMSQSFEDLTVQTAHTTDKMETQETTDTAVDEAAEAGPSLEEMAEFVKLFAPALQQPPQQQQQEQQAAEVPELDTETLQHLQLQLRQNATALLDLQKQLFQKGSADFPAANGLQIVQTLHQSLATAVSLSRIPMSYLTSKKGIKKAKKDLGMEKKKETAKTRFSARSMSGQVKSEYAVWSMR